MLTGLLWILGAYLGVGLYKAIRWRLIFGKATYRWWYYFAIPFLWFFMQPWMWIAEVMALEG